MDQDSFRQLLQTPRPGGTGSTTLGVGGKGGRAGGLRGSLLVGATSGSSKSKTLEAGQPAFKPRKVKKASASAAGGGGGSGYRDRASERRVGEGNDYAEVEAVLEDFEKRNADNEDRELVEQQRRYLGGDSEHSILVKGLDIALLEQNKARAAAQSTIEADEELERAFLESSSVGMVAENTETEGPQAGSGKKRTREELLKKLKAKRLNSENGGGGGDDDATGSVTTKAGKTAGEEARLLEEAKKKGKFKPIGFKPIGSGSSSADVAADGRRKKKKKAVAETGEAEEGRKKKKRKVEPLQQASSSKTTTDMPPPPLPVAKSVPPEPEPESLDPEFDIFADAGEYEGIDLGGDDDDDEGEDNGEKDEGEIKDHKASPPQRTLRSEDLEEGEEPTIHRQWIETDEDQRPALAPPLLTPLKSNSPPPPSRRKLHGEDVDMEDRDNGEEEEQPMRLVPLASSALPSIKDLLAIDKAAGARDKYKKRKDKKGAKGGAGGDDEGAKKKSAEVKAERDYKKLKSYTDKKNAVGPS